MNHLVLASGRFFSLGSIMLASASNILSGRTITVVATWKRGQDASNFMKSNPMLSVFIGSKEQTL